MLTASAYIIVCSAKNRLRTRLRRLREPRYLIGAAAGAAYLYFAVFARFTATRRVRRRGAVPPSDGMAGALAGGASVVGGLMLLAIATLAWVVPSTSTLFVFSEAETHLLFPAPVTRRELLVHRLMRSQIGFLIASVVAAFFVTAPQMSSALGLVSLGARVRNVAAFWLIFVTARLYFAGVLRVRRHLFSRDPRVLTIAWVPLIATLLAVAGVGIPLVRALLSPSVTSASDVFGQFAAVLSSGWPRVALWPFTTIVSLLFAPWPGPYLLRMIESLPLTAAAAAWVMRIDEVLQDDDSASRAPDVSRSRSAVRNGRAMPWTLPLTGRAEVTFLWKNATSTLRTTDLGTVLPWMIVGVMLTTAGSTARMAATGTRGPALALAMGSLMGAAFAAILGPQAMRADLRGDLAHLDLLKTWPVRSGALIRGEMAWPSLFLTLLVWLALTCGTIFSAAAFPQWPLVWRLSVAAAAFVVAPALIAAQFAVHNTAAVLFPAWVPTGNQRPRGFDAMGQRLVLFGGVLLGLVVVAGPGAIAGGILTFAFYRLVGPISLVPAAVVATIVVGIEILVITEMLGAAFDRIDLAQVERAES